MSTRDPSLFGWLLPPPGQLHPIGELLFVAIGYGFLLWLIIKLMKHFLSSKPWHKWLRRGIWTVLAVLMFIDPFYYYFGIVRGYCAEDQARVYPAPPASYVLAGPMPYDELKNVDVTGYERTYKEVNYWPCQNDGFRKDGWCIVRDVEYEPGDWGNPIPFAFEKNVLSQFIDTNTGIVYSESNFYDGAGHWMTRLLFGAGFAWIDYPSWHSCSDRNASQYTIINLNQGE